MATIVYSGSSSDTLALSAARTVSLTKESGSASGLINSVVASLTFSTNAYSNTYNVTATLNYSGGSISSARAIKMDSSNYTSGTFDFTFNGLTADQANSIKSVTLSCSDSTSSKIFVKGSQTVTIDYTVIGKTTAPTTVKVSATNVAPGASVTLSWSGAAAGAVNPITGYKIFQATSSSGSYSLIATVSSAATSGSTTVTAPTGIGSSYYYKVQTIGTYSGYDSDNSAAASLTCTVTAAGTPTTVTVSATNVAPGANVTLSWLGASAGTNNPITGYKVLRADSQYGTYSLLKTITTTAASGSTTVNAPTASGSSYYYKVQTIGTYSGYDSDNSAAASLTCTVTAAGAPEAISLSATNVSPGAKVALSWSGASAGTNNPITGYKIYRAESQYGSYSLLTTVSSTSTGGSATVTAPTTNGSSYYYKVRTVGTYSGYDSDDSPSVGLTCSFASTSAPTKVSIAATNAAPGAEVQLSWSGASEGDNNAITGYGIYQADSADGEYTLFTTVAETATSGSATVTAPTENGATYYYRVLTLGTLTGSDSSLSSAYAALTCTYSTPAAPTVRANGAASAYAKPGGSVTLSWSGAADGANNPITGYTVYRDGAVLAANLGTSVSSYTVTAHSTTGNAYAYTVVSVGTYSNSAPSVACTVYSYTDPTAPTQVAVSDSKPNAGAKVTLSWSGATSGGYNAITGYRVYRSNTAGGTYTMVSKVTTSATSGTCKVTAPAITGSAYYYRVETIGAYSSSGMSTVYAAVTAGEQISADTETKVYVRPQPRKRRGIIFGDYDTVQDGKWTLTGWEFSEPEPITTYVDVPGRKAGPLDLTEALTGYPTYGSRQLNATFECSDSTRMDRELTISNMVNRLHGRKMKIILPDDDAHYAIGRLTVHKEYNDMAHASVTVSAVCEPWRYSKTETVIELVAGSAARIALLPNSGSLVVAPEITVTGENAWSETIQVQLTAKGTTWRLAEGKHILPDLVLHNGNTRATYTGSGTMTIRYQEAIL